MSSPELKYEFSYTDFARDLIESVREYDEQDLALFDANLEVGGMEGRDEFARELGRQWVLNQSNPQRLLNFRFWLERAKRIDRFATGRPPYTMGQMSAQGMAEMQKRLQHMPLGTIINTPSAELQIIIDNQ